MYYTRHPNIKLRREYFGGIVFDKSNGKLIEVDKGVIRLLELSDGRKSIGDIIIMIKNELNININPSELHFVMKFLKNHEILVKDIESYPIKSNKWPKKTRHLSAPESVHLAITHRCNQLCQSCYVDETNTTEMTLTEIKSVIDVMADMKIFQLAIGGGEPLLRDDFIEIVRYAKQCDIVPNITTNGSLINSYIINELSDYVGQIQLSVNGHCRKLHESNRQDGSFNTVLNTIKIFQKYNIQFGLNVLLCKDNLKNIEDIVKFGINKGATTINFIRLKPSLQNRVWYDKSALSTNDYKTLAFVLQNLVSKYPTILITVDCALVFLMNKLSPLSLQKGGVYGCAGGVRFVSIHPNGNVYPCSFLNLPNFCAGNVIKDDLKMIWNNKFQDLRNIFGNLSSKCGSCYNKNFCMGCRAIALHENGDIHSNDNGCFK